MKIINHNNKRIVTVETTDLQKEVPYSKLCGVAIDELFLPEQALFNHELCDVLIPKVVSNKQSQLFIYHEYRPNQKKQLKAHPYDFER